MSKFFRYWSDEIDRNWMVAPVLIVWAVTAGFNARMGFEMGGGWDEFVGSALYAVMFIGLAALGAWGFARASAEAGGFRAAMLLLGCLQLAVGLQAGFQSFGLTLAKGAAGMESKADARRTVTDQLRQARDEREKIGTPRAIGTIQAEATLECRRTSAQFKDGVGPACTKLRGELEAAKRAGALDKQIQDLSAALGKAPKIKNADANFEVAMAIASGVSGWWTGREIKLSADDIRFAFTVFMVSVLEIVGVMGFWLTGVGHGAPARAQPGAPAGFLEPPSAAYRRSMGLAPLRRVDVRGGSSGQSHVTPVAASEPDVLAPVGAPAAAPAHGGPSHGGTVHGAPISLTLNMAANDRGTRVEPAQIVAPAATPLLTSEPAPRAPRHDVGVVADAVPADRTGVLRLTDQLVAFKAACVVAVTGAHVTADDLYRRYVGFCGANAVNDGTFHTLFPDLAGVETAEVGGALHYQGIALRAPALVAVAS